MVIKNWLEVWMSERVSVSVCWLFDWLASFQSVPRLSSCDSWDNLQPPPNDPELLVGLELDKQLRN